MRSVIYIVAALVLALVITIAAIPLIVSPDSVQREAIDRLEALTGYEITVGGSPDLRMFPDLEFELTDIALRTPDAPEGEYFATAQALAGSVGLLPLLTGRVEIDSFTLVGPRFSLSRTETGRSNWAVEDAGLVDQAAEEPSRLPIRDIQVGEIRIENGHFSLIDGQSRDAIDISSVDLSLKWPNLASAASGSGRLTWRGEALEFGFQIDAPLALVRGEPSPARVNIGSEVVDIGFTGTATSRDTVHLDGSLELATPSVRNLVRWTGNDLGTGPGLDGLQVSGALSFDGRTAAVGDMTMTLDGNRAEGSLQVTTGEPLGIEGTLAFDALNLDRYRAPSQSSDQSGATPAQGRTGAGSSLQDLPLELSELSRVTADIRLSAGEVIYDNHRLGQTAGTVQVRDGTMTLGIGDTQIYDGRGSGTVTMRQAGAGAQMRAAIALEGISARPLVAALTDSERLEGTGNASFNVVGDGGTVGQILSRLSGEARISFVDGTIRGIDLARAVEALRNGSLSGWPLGDDMRTPFGNLSASYTISQGTASTQDFRLAGPQVVVDAQGDVGLVATTVDGRGTAGLIGGGTVEAPEYAIPFVIEGTLARPTIYPDPAWLLDQTIGSSEDVGRVRERIEEIVPPETLDGLLQDGLEGLRLPELFGQPSGQ